MKFAPTFKHTPIDSIDYVRMTIFNDNGSIMEEKHVYSNYDYAIIYFELIKTCNYDKHKIITTWNNWWNSGVLDGLKYDIEQYLNRII